MCTGWTAEETPERTAVRRRGTGLAAVVALVVGLIAAAALLAKYTWYDDPCPDFDDEGMMAAPGSRYAQLMCRAAVTFEPVPMEQVELPWALLGSAAVAAIGVTVLVWLRPRLSRAAAGLGLVGVLIAPSLLVVALQHGLPRDCASGRSDAGECSRDRESR
ncbi:MAG: hypothetical protein WB471_10550 [Nocardioides sp.]